MSLFTQKEIAETNAKTEEKMRQDVFFELMKRFKPDRQFSIDEVAQIFVVLAAKTIFVPDNHKMGMKP